MSLDCAEFVVLDRKVAQRLAVCPFLRKVLFSASGSPQLHRCWNMCDLDKAHCDFSGRRLKFDKHCNFRSLRIVWVCPKIGDKSFLDGL